MVGSDLLWIVDQHLREIMGINKLFGCTTVVVFGDLYQLAPVGQRFVFDATSDPYARLAGLVWQDNFQIVELTEIMRQRDDQSFAELLNRVRLGEHTEEDIKCLEERVISPEAANYPGDALHVFGRNEKVHQFNERKLAMLCGPEI